MVHIYSKFYENLEKRAIRQRMVREEREEDVEVEKQISGFNVRCLQISLKGRGLVLQLSIPDWPSY